VTFTVDALPLSWNMAYGRHGKVTYLRPAGRKTIERIGWAWLAAGSPRTGSSARLAVTVRMTFSNRRRCDLDNRAKLLLDGLRKCGAIGDDSQIDDLRLVRVYGDIEQTEITVTECDTKSADGAGRV